MRKTILSVLLSFVLASSALAQTSTPIRQQIREVQQNVRQEIEGVRENFRQEVLQSREELRRQFEADVEAARKLMEQKREEFRKALEAKRVQLQALIKSKRTELQSRLAKIKNESKQQAVLRIDSQLDELNKRLTDHYSDVLDNLAKILDNIGARAAKAEANGIDIASVNTAVTAAKNAIAQSRTAILTQAGKIYKITINTETTLKTDVGKARQALHADLVKTRETVKAAHEAVRKAATTLAQIPRVDELEVPGGEATTTEPQATSTQ